MELTLRVGSIPTSGTNTLKQLAAMRHALTAASKLSRGLLFAPFRRVQSACGVAQIVPQTWL